MLAKLQPLLLPDGVDGVATLSADGHTMEYINDRCRHGKTNLAIGASKTLPVAAAILPVAGKDPGILLAKADEAAKAAADFVVAISMHRHADRDSDPPRI